MTLAELHPEEMLDGARHGALGSEAALDLDAHLRRCSACHLHLQLGQDAAFEGRLDRRDRALHARLVAVALGGLEDGAAEPPASTEAFVAGATAARSAAAWAWPVFRRLLLAAACILLGGGVATAMWSVASNARRPAAVNPIAPTPTSIAARVAPAHGRHVATVEHRPPQSSWALPVPPTEAPARARRRGPSPVVRHDVTVVEPTVEPPPALTASALFREANDLRRAGDHAGALLRYDQLGREFPGTREEITGRVIAGQLQLGSDLPLLALAGFDSYLDVSPSGTLAEEARVGRARALGALSRTDDEVDAWRNLLLRHPSSIHVERARARLRQLGQ
jgi:hypothetical protein